MKVLKLVVHPSPLFNDMGSVVENKETTLSQLIYQKPVDTQ